MITPSINTWVTPECGGGGTDRSLMDVVQKVNSKLDIAIILRVL